MRIVREAKVKSGKDLYTEKFEFRYCTGSIEPDQDEDETALAGDAAQGEPEQR